MYKIDTLFSILNASESKMGEKSQEYLIKKSQHNVSHSSIKHFFTLPNNKGRYRDVTIKDLKEKISEMTLLDRKVELDDIEQAMESLAETYWFPKAKTTKISTWAGWPKNIQATFKHSHSLQTFERHCLYEMIKKCKSVEAFLEILTKSLIYREMETGTIIPAPRYDDPEKLEFYKVEKTIVTAKGFTAALLVPVMQDSKSPKILTISGSNFHPTGVDTLSSIIEDMKWTLGEGAYISAEKEIKALMKQTEDGSLIVTGHSLGGTLAQYITGLFPEKVQRLITYNAPGVNSWINHVFNTKAQKLDHNIKIDIYQTAWDVVHEAEYPHLGYDLGYNHKKVKLSLTRFLLDNVLTTLPHTYLCLSNPNNIDVAVDTFGITSLKPVDLKNRTWHKYHAYQMEPYLNNLTRDILEVFRKTIGCLSTPFLELWRSFYRSLVSTRAKPSELVDNDEEFKEQRINI